jgi:hypothetical protein
MQGRSAAESIADIGSIGRGCQRLKIYQNTAPTRNRGTTSPVFVIGACTYSPWSLSRAVVADQRFALPPVGALASLQDQRFAYFDKRAEKAIGPLG